MSLVWEHYPAGGGELLTALAYADHAHDDGAGVRPSIAYMSKKTRQSERTIQMHVAAMRSTTWLLTVRHAAGGRGRTTEYRINPVWIANPAGFAPFLSTPERTQSGATKGAVDSTKGCKAFAPQPSRTVIEPTTTSTNTSERSGVVVAEPLRLPDVLAGDARAPALRLMGLCPVALRQTVLDEIAGLADRGAVRHPLGLLRHLVAAATKGDFVPSAAIEHGKRLVHERAERECRETEDADRQRRSTPEAREAGRRALEEVRSKLGLPPFAPAPSSSVAAKGGRR